jgi:glycosyltransferase involved in cell wall biosynthesis
MKVLLIHRGDQGLGGGQVALQRLQRGLTQTGVEAHILCANPTRDDSIAIPRRRRVEAFLGKVTRWCGLNDLHCVSSFGIKHLPAYQQADILDFHSIHSGFFNYLALPGLTAQKPAVFTLHDMWPFTGHCHASLDCERWKSGCGKCPYLSIAPALRRDTSRLEWKLKHWVYQHARLTLVAPSSWLVEQVKHSMLSHFPLHHIPFGIDTHLYQPLDPERCRSLLRIPAGKKVVLFVAEELNRHLKGSDLLVQALRSLPEALKRDTLLLLLGRGGGTFAKLVDMPMLDLGFVSSDHLKAIVYSAADIFVSPTRAESFGLVLLESMACGTPLVSFRVGGVPDLVRPGVTGYLAQPGDAYDLAKGIVQLLEDEPLRLSLRQQCRLVATREYSLELYIHRYLSLYRSLIEGSRQRQQEEHPLLLSEVPPSPPAQAALPSVF